MRNANFIGKDVCGISPRFRWKILKNYCVFGYIRKTFQFLIEEDFVSIFSDKK